MILSSVKRSICLIAVVLSLEGVAQPREDVNVAIFLYDGMELLDFAGPTEVFASAGFHTYSVTRDGGPVECNRTGEILNKITPDYSMTAAPTPDIVVFPGGGTRKISTDTVVLEWVKKQAKEGTFMMSVCTGAAVLANTGLLDGMNVTTWYGFIPGLQASHPELKVLDSTRYVDNGVFLTTAGVSAGIDGALHLVSRIKGLDVAKSVAEYMEYDKWDPTQGRVDRPNALIERMRNEKWSQDEMLKAMAAAKSPPFEGELKNLASDLGDLGRIEDAAFVLELCIKHYGGTHSSYDALARLYTKLGRAVPAGEEAYVEMVKQENYEMAWKQLDEDRKKFPGWITVRHGGQLTRLAVDDFNAGNYARALKALELVAHADPGYGSYYYVGEVQRKMGNNEAALEAFRKSLAHRPGDEAVIRIIGELEEKLGSGG